MQSAPNTPVQEEYTDAKAKLKQWIRVASESFSVSGPKSLLQPDRPGLWLSSAF